MAHAGLRSLRHRMVSLFHAPPRRTPRQRFVHCQESVAQVTLSELLHSVSALPHSFPIFCNKPGQSTPSCNKTSRGFCETASHSSWEAAQDAAGCSETQVDSRLPGTPLGEA